MTFNIFSIKIFHKNPLLKITIDARKKEKILHPQTFTWNDIEKTQIQRINESTKILAIF